MPTQVFYGSVDGLKAVTIISSDNLAINSNFDLGDTGWVKGTGWTVEDVGAGNYKAVCTTGTLNEPIYQQATNYTVGKVYQVTAVVSDFTDGSLQVSNTTTHGNLLTGVGTSTMIFQANSTTHNIAVYNRSVGSDFKVDSISLYEIPLTVSGDVFLDGNIRIVIPTYANNAAALAGGLIPGEFYRVNAATDPEPIYIVHA
jgi:hypothetical protein